MKKLAYTAAVAAMVASIGAAPAYAESAQDNAARNTTASTAAANAADMTVVSFTGTVGPVTDDDEFQLNYGGGTVKVDTNDAWRTMFKGKANNIGSLVKEGDQITVMGRMDDNWFTQREVDAYRIYNNQGKMILSGDTNNDSNVAYQRVEEGNATLTGRVSKVINDERVAIRYGTSNQVIEVDTTGLDNPPALKVGDRITVSGDIDDTMFTDREINAETLRKM